MRSKWSKLNRYSDSPDASATASTNTSPAYSHTNVPAGMPTRHRRPHPFPGTRNTSRGNAAPSRTHAPGGGRGTDAAAIASGVSTTPCSWMARRRRSASYASTPAAAATGGGDTGNSVESNTATAPGESTKLATYSKSAGATARTSSTPSLNAGMANRSAPLATSAHTRWRFGFGVGAFSDPPTTTTPTPRSAPFDASTGPPDTPPGDASSLASAFVRGSVAGRSRRASLSPGTASRTKRKTAGPSAEATAAQDETR